MESEIVFCERCGVSIPEHEVARGRQASEGRDLCPTCLAPAAGEGDLQLYFCENCRVSIAVSDVLTEQARPEGSGYLCAVCSRCSPAERVARRTAVEREMRAAPGGGPAGRVPTAPLYFCEGCSASIPAAVVATGRALVEGGRTWCENCRSRRERATPRPSGPGLVPVAAAALLAAGLTAGVFVALERRDAARAEGEAAAGRDTALEGLRRDVRAARETAETVRGEATARMDRVQQEADRRFDALRVDVGAARDAAEKALAAAGTAGAARIAKLESRQQDLEEEMNAGLRALAERIDRVGEKVAAAAGARTEAPPVAAPPPVAMPPGPGPAPAPGAPALAPEVLRTVELLKDKAAENRFAAAIELGKLGEKAAWPHLVEALRRDEDPFVRRASCRSLGELKAYEAFPDIVEALSDGEEYVAKQASMVIREMAGQDFAYKQNQPKGERRKVADRARKWWEENRARLLPGGE